MALTKVTGQGLETLSDGVTITVTDTSDVLSLVSTDAGAGSGPGLNLYRNSSSGASGDGAGKIAFHAEDANSDLIRLVAMFSTMTDATNGSEDGAFHISTMTAGTERDKLHIYPTETVFNEDSQDVDFRVESNGVTNAFVIDGGNNGIGFGATPRSDLHTSWTQLFVGKKGSILSELNTGGGIEQIAIADNLYLDSDTGAFALIETNEASIISQAGGTHLFRTAASGSAGAAPTLVEQMRLGASEVVINEGSADLDFRVESNANTHAFHINANDENIGFGNQINITQNGMYMHIDANNAHMVITNLDDDDDVPLLKLNRQTADGRLLYFLQANSLEGTVSVSGSTVSYNGFAGRHESSGIPTNTAVGTVLSTIDELDTYPATTQNEALEAMTHPKAGQARADHAKVKVSDSVGDKRVYGVVNEFDSDEKVYVTSVGISAVKVTGACAGGDLIESNGDGTAKVQSDDIVRSKTIGKVTIGNSSSSVKLVSCVLYCG